MKYLHIAGTDLQASNIIMGCMRLASLSKTDAELLIRKSPEPKPRAKAPGQAPLDQTAGADFICICKQSIQIHYTFFCPF